jgi:hypothetical protein
MPMRFVSCCPVRNRGEVARSENASLVSSSCLFDPMDFQHIEVATPPDHAYAPAEQLEMARRHIQAPLSSTSFAKDRIKPSPTSKTPTMS